MIEKPKDLLAERREIVIKAAQNPVFFLERNKTKGCHAGLVFLLQVRHEIRKDATYSIESPDPLFRKFYEVSNSTPEYYEALVSILKGTGYTKDEINEACFEWLQNEAVDSQEIRGAIPHISTLCQNAVEKIFKTDLHS